MQQSPVEQNKTNETVLDVRGMQAPDNIMVILQKANELGSALEFRIESSPFQLYDLLQQRGFFLEIEPQEDGSFLGRLKPRETKALKH